MKFLFIFVAIGFVCTIVASQESEEKSEGDENQLVAATKDEEPGLRAGAQQPVAQQEDVYSQFSQGYSNQYPYNGASQMQYGLPQQISPYQSYPSQINAPYQYGYNQRRQQATWNPQLDSRFNPNLSAEPLIGNKFWEYPTINSKLPQPYNQQQRNFRGAPARQQNVQKTWYQPPQPQQPFYYGRRPIQRWQDQNSWVSQPKPVAPKPNPFDPTSEEYYQAEYSTGSVQASNSGIELIPTEMEKGPDGKATKISRARAWHNYHTGKPMWSLQKPIIPRAPQPIDSWTPRPDYVPANNWRNPVSPRSDYISSNNWQNQVSPRPEYVPSNNWPNQVSPRPDIETQTQTTCYNNCRRRCGMGKRKCGWNSNCGGSGCQAARTPYRANTNARNWRNPQNGQYWGAAAQWNNGPVKQQIQVPSVVSNESKDDVTEEASCSPEMASSGEWKWVNNKWKWVCNNLAAEDGSGEEVVIDA